MVQCKDCGLLALRRTDTRELGEAEQDFRDTGRIPGIRYIHSTGDFEDKYEPPPLCSQMAADLPLECGDSEGGRVRILQVLVRERECNSFLTWMPGFSPKEHIEMQMSEQRDERDRRWRAEDRRAARTDILIGALLAGAIAIITGVVTAFVIKIYEL